MDREDFVAFRRAYPSAEAAVAACERPDWLILLASEALDRKAAIRVGVDAAQLLEASDGRDARRLFTPYPDRLEAVALWADHVDDDARTFANLRAIATAAPLAGAAAYLGDRLVAPADGGVRLIAFVAMLVGFAAGLAVLIRILLAALVRRRAAALDADRALGVVLDAIAAAMTRRPAKVPLVAQSVGGLVRALLHRAAP